MTSEADIQHIKVCFNGESMWVKVDSMSDDSLHARGTLVNHPLNVEMHNYRYGDEVVCRWVIRPEYSYWEPVHAVNPEVSDGEESQYAL